MGCESANEERIRKRQNKPVSLNDTEKAILECKTCRDKIKKYIRSLEQKEEKSRDKAKELVKKKQKERAKLYLKQCKLFREQKQVADGKLVIINEQIVNIESACNMQECMKCLQQGNAVLQQLQKEVNIEHWENIRDGMDELRDRDREIGDFIKERGIDEVDYEAAAEDELNKLINEMQSNNELNLPEVPKTKIEDDRIPVKQNQSKVKNKTKNKVLA